MGAQCTCCGNQNIGEAAHYVADTDIKVATTSTLRHSLPKETEAEDNIEEIYRFDIGKDGIVGHSSLGTIAKTHSMKSKAIFVVKQMNKGHLEGDGWKEDVQTLRTLDHPHICKVNDSWEDAMNVYLIMEFCKGGNLMNLAARRKSRINESTIAVLVRQMVDALSHLHEHNMVHSDVRPENWLFDTEPDRQQNVFEMNLKMIDFGFATKHGTKRRGSILAVQESSNDSVLSELDKISWSVASSSSQKRRESLKSQTNLFCKSPEQISLGGLSVDPKSDIWAIGVIAYFLLSGQSPFQWAAYKEDLAARAKYTFMPPELWRPVSSEAKSFIALCLQQESDKRPSAPQALRLPWMQLAKAAMEESCIVRADSPNSSSGASQLAKLSIHDPPLDTADRVMVAFNRMNQLNGLEKACVITAAHRMPASKIVQFANNLVNIDRMGQGLVSAEQLFEALKTCGVPIKDLMNLMKVAKGIDQDLGDSIDYPELICALDELQRNMQDCAVWNVFKTFDENALVSVPKKYLTETLKKGQDGVTTLCEKFPACALDCILEELDADTDGAIDANEFKRMLRRSEPTQPAMYL